MRVIRCLSPRRRALEADAAALVDLIRWGPLHHALMAIPEPVRKYAWDSYTCPACEDVPAGGWQWWTEAGTHFERLHLVLRCQRNHSWTVDTDMG
ncbi:hypothetical protein [Nocardia brasiliensis]|uniref:hypothetical protein n=1 Tax=Nocardia brasiliensis TaxID=37326 RepID=UPI0024580550|nr:hypothetical protein [Nocardia brasiliensis]